MPTYQYVVKNLFTGAVIAEPSLYGVYCTREMNRTGVFQGTYMFTPDSVARNSAFLDATAPGKYGLTMLRNGVEIWGGIIWSRSYSAQGQVMQIFANTWESYFDHMTFWKDHFIQQAVAQETIFQNMVNQLQGQSAACNIGLFINSLPSTGYKRTVLIPNYEYHFGSDALQQLVGVDLGLEYTINPNKEIILAAEGQLGEQSTSPSMAYDFPGQITNYWMPESGASGAIKIATLGAGAGNKILRATTTDQDSIDAGYPEWWKVTQYPMIADINTLQDKNVSDFRKYRMPYHTPTFEMQPDEGFSHFNGIGNDFAVTIQDLRYPAGKTFVSRMLGWELTPESSSGPENLKIAVDGSGIVA